jgi:hypothetical protein
MANTFSNGNLLFSPTIIQRAIDGSGAVTDATLTDYSGSNITGSNSFRFDEPGTPFKSTQQIPLDWSKFENHTFFNSAESKVNVAFDTIINYFPFDGTNDEIQTFMDGLNGWEKHVFDKFPKQIGYLCMSGTLPTENPEGGFNAGLGTFIRVHDVAGSLYPSLSKDTSGLNIIDPGLKSISFQFWIHLPPEACKNQVIFQKLSDTNQGYSMFVSESAANRADVVFIASSGSNAITASYNIPKDEMLHISANFDRESTGLSSLKIFKTGSLVASSSYSTSFGLMDFQSDPLLIGSGAAHDMGSLGTGIFTPEVTLSGCLDDFRCYHGGRTSSAIKSNYLSDAFPTSSLRLYLKFNEASGSYANNSVVLDSSGFSLHSHISNFHSSSRDYKLGSPHQWMSLERSEINPVLFPGNADVLSFNQLLLASASQYDNNNPNLITKLIPEHYLLEADLEEGFEDIYAGTGDDYSYSIDFPGGGRIGQPQIIASLLFTWAKFFDEIKLFTDQFGNLLRIDYDDSNTVASHMLPFFSKYYGFVLPNNFSNASYAQYLLGENLEKDPAIAASSLYNVQSEIWRRILVNLSSIIESKGTLFAIKSVMRAAGINPDSMFRFREFGGSRTITTDDARRSRSEVASQLWLSSSKERIISPYLSSSRKAPGFPYASNPTLPRRSDGLLTSGSWTYEGLYQFDFRNTSNQPLTQSLIRFWTTGSWGVAGQGPGALVSNLIAYGTGSKGNVTGSLKLFLRPGPEDNDPVMKLVLTGVNIFDQDRWHVSFGRNVGSPTGSLATASYFIRAARATNGDIAEFYQTSSIFGLGDRGSLVFNTSSDDYNASGSYFEFGGKSTSQALDTSGNKFLNASSIITDADARNTSLSAKVSGVRFWTKALTSKETKEHARNFKSVGVEDPQVNFNFVTSISGSWERLRIDASLDQLVTKSDSSGELSVFDFSQNSFFLTGSGFELSKQVINPALFRYTILDPSFGERSAENKIRVRGFQKDLNIQEFNTLKSPVRQIEPGQPTLDDSRFSIEVSAVGALNEDIVNILAGLDWLDSAIGNPELQFASDYPALRRLREVYFHRLTDKVNFKNLFLFYKWFDDSLSIIIERLIPRTTKYMGINFVIESHFLERPKFRNMNNNIYLSAADRRGINDELLMAVLSGFLKRY